MQQDITQPPPCVVEQSVRGAIPTTSYVPHRVACDQLSIKTNGPMALCSVRGRLLITCVESFLPAFHPFLFTLADVL